MKFQWIQMRHYVFINRAYVIFNISLNTSTQISEAIQLEKKLLGEMDRNPAPNQEMYTC